MVKAVFFDLDDTLLWDKKSIATAFEKTGKIAEDRFGVDAKKLEKTVRKVAQELYSAYESYSFTQLIGINPFEGLWGDFNDKEEGFQKLREIVPEYRQHTWTLGLKIMGIDNEEFGCELSERFVSERKKAPFVYEDTFSVLDALKSKFRLLLLTNGSPELQKMKLSMTSELVPYFEHIVISGEYGKGKPDPGIFAYALQKMNLTNGEVIMVGDNLHTDILGANRSGIQSVWVNRHDLTAKEIKPTFEIKCLSELIEIVDTL
jgi:putative hydrolase of the HAD superfamily